MDYDVPKSNFYKATMTGLFVGIMVTLICLLFNFIYRNSTGFSLSDIINVSSLIFFTNLLFLVVGGIYGLLNSSRKGEIIFIVAMVLLTVLLAWRAEYAHRADNETLNHQFRGLLVGVIVIMGISASFLVPYLYHNKKFEDQVI